MNATDINSEVAFCAWPAAPRRMVDPNATSKLSQPRTRRRSGLEAAGPALKEMHRRHGTDAEGHSCGDCALVYVSRTKKLSRGGGGTVNIYHCRRHMKERGHVMNQIWALRWPACGKFQVGGSSG